MNLDTRHKLSHNTERWHRPSSEHKLSTPQNQTELKALQTPILSLFDGSFKLGSTFHKRQIGASNILAVP